MLIRLMKKVPNLVKDGYSLLMLTPETQDLLESGESRKIMINSFVDQLEKYSFFSLVFNIVLGLFMQLQNFLQFYLIGLLGFLIGLELLEL